MYPDYIMQKVRQNLGLEEDDYSRDEEIHLMSKNTVFDRCLVWEGICGYGEMIRNMVIDIYKVKI